MTSSTSTENGFTSFNPRRVAICGAGVMGAQIAAFFAACGVSVLLYDLDAKEPPYNAIVLQALQRLSKLKPAPAPVGTEALIEPCSYDKDLEKLKYCDLVIEVVAENAAIKEALFKKIAPMLHPQAVLASNTSGISINTLASYLPDSLRSRFCGIHFFNPPRYMHLVELTPCAETMPSLLDALESFIVKFLGKGVVRAKDTPNFIANRVGVFSMLATIHHALKLKLGFDEVDALTGVLIGRPKSATFRTLDVVGLDTMAHVIGTMTTELKQDPWAPYYEVPAFLQQLVKAGALGQKTGVGVYKKEGQAIFVYDVKLQDYRPADKGIHPELHLILQEPDTARKFQALAESKLPQAKFLWAIFRDTFHYCAYHLTDIADTVRDVDLAMMWGFGWQQGPFTTWQHAGWGWLADHLAADIAAKVTMADVALPSWVNQINAPYQSVGAYAPATQQFEPARKLPVYEALWPRVRLPEQIAPEMIVIWDKPAGVLWHQSDDIAIFSLKTKNNTIGLDAIAALSDAIITAEQSYRGLIIWPSQGDNFSYGANLKEFQVMFETAPEQEIAAAVSVFQEMCMRLRYALVPTVVALRGLTLGGGCELSMHASRRVAAFETYIGLVEAGVGLLPGGGGTKEFAYKASVLAPDDPLRLVKEFFTQLAMGHLCGSATEAKTKHYLRRDDVIVANTEAILHVAKAEICAMNAAGYRPPHPPAIKVAGRPGIATLQSQLVNMLEGGFISPHDYDVSLHIASVLCGGDVEAGTLVSESWLLKLEREAFAHLAKQPKTQARIAYMLKEGKPLRN